MEGWFGKVCKLGDEILRSKGGVRKKIVGWEGVMSGGCVYDVKGKVEFGLGRVIKGDGVWIVGIRVFGKRVFWLVGG